MSSPSLFTGYHALRSVFGLLVALGLSLAVSGCEPSRSSEPKTPSAPAKQSPQLPDAPQRIVSLAPNLTEILFAIGAGPQVVAVTRFCDRPADEVAKLPKIGGFVDPELEPIAAQRPDLVVGVTSAGDPAFARQLAAAEIPYLYLQMEDLEQTYAGIERLGETTGQQGEARALVARLREQMAAVEPARDSPRVLFVFGHKPLIAAGPGTFADELVRRAGGTNVVQGELTYPTLDLEKIVELRPDVILDGSTVSGAEADVTAFWDRFDTLPAVAEGRVHAFEQVSLLRPGPGLPEALSLIAARLRGDEG